MSQDPPDIPGMAIPDRDDRLGAALMLSRVLQDAPEPVVLRAIELFDARDRVPAVPQPPQVLRRLVAVLGFDSALRMPKLAGLRAAGASDRMILYQTEGRDIDLRIAPGAQGWQISGQVLGPDEHGQVEVRCGDFRAQTAWGDSSEFHLHGIPAGRWRLALQGADWAVELPDLHVPGADG